MSYEEFGALRFLDFFSETPVYDDDDIGGTVTIIGYACTAGYGFTRFARLEGQSQTGAITLDFSHDCPESEGNALLARLGFLFCKGSPFPGVAAQLGAPAQDHANPEGFRFCSFLAGEPRPYHVTCAFNPNGELFKFGIARNDLVQNNRDAC